MLFLFDKFSVDTERRELRRDGEPRPVEPQVFELLEYLLRNRDRVVTRDDLLAERRSNFVGIQRETQHCVERYLAFDRQRKPRPLRPSGFRETSSASSRQTRRLGICRRDRTR